MLVLIEMFTASQNALFPQATRCIWLHGPVFSAKFGASGGGGFGKIIFGYHNKLFSNALYQREPNMSQN